MSILENNFIICITCIFDIPAFCRIVCYVYILLKLSLKKIKRKGIKHGVWVSIIYELG